MIALINTIVIGVGVGSLYALSAQGMVLVFRGAGIVNFAHAGFGILGAYLHFSLIQAGVPWGWAFAGGVAAAAVAGAALHFLVLKPLRHSALIMRLVATLAVLILAQGIGGLLFGADVKVVPSVFPNDSVFLGEVELRVDRVALIVISLAATVLLWLVFRYTSLGRATTAIAENTRAGSALGISPDRIAVVNWALGSALAAGTAILVVPVTGLAVTALVNLSLISLAAALVGRFTSFWLTFVGGVTIGVGETLISRFTDVQGLASIVPLAVVLAVLIVAGKGIPSRDVMFQRLPSVGSGRVRPVLVFILSAIFVALTFVVPATWNDSFTTTLTVGIVLLSVIVLTGYAGQLSLGQWAFAGLGAFVSGRLVAEYQMPFELALLVSMVAAAVFGVIVGLPATRVRGVNLAIVTFALGVTIEMMIFKNSDLTGGFLGTTVGYPKVFGIEISSILYPGRYAILCFVLFLLLALIVANVRRGRTGRRMLATRSNERAAAALGISVPSAKLYAFALASAIAAVGGTLVAFRSSTIVYSDFANSYSTTLLAMAVIGGVGWIAGAPLGATLATGAIGTQIITEIAPGAASFFHVIAGLVLLIVILLNPDGLAKPQAEMVMGLAHGIRRLPFLSRKTGGGRVTVPATQVARALPENGIDKVEPKTLAVRDLTVRFGNVVAVSDVSLTIKPGKVLGLIGPNGAGKSTLIDAVSGFVSPSSGAILLDGSDITAVSATNRSRAGVSRSFQSLELFEDLSTLDNLRAAYDPRDAGSYLYDLVKPRISPMPERAAVAISEFRLEDQLDKQADTLAYGVRRLLSIARAIVSGPSVVLLDEPIAGLGKAEREEFARLVRRLADEWGMAVLLVEHDIDFVMGVCDEIAVLNFGEMISHGTPSEVRSDPAVIRAYLGTEGSDVDGPKLALELDGGTR